MGVTTVRTGNFTRKEKGRPKQVTNEADTNSVVQKLGAQEKVRKKGLSTDWGRLKVLKNPVEKGGHEQDIGA